MNLEYTNQQNAINQLSFNNAHSLFSHTDELKIIIEDADNKRVGSRVGQCFLFESCDSNGWSVCF